MARHFEGNPPEIMVRPGGAVVSTNAVFGSAPANACPVHSLPADASVRQLTSPPGAERVDPAEAEEFIRLYHQENPQAGPPEARLRQVRVHIERFGTYWHTTDELAHGARVAWRNNSRCIGRLYWRSLRVRDRREVTGADEIAAECVAHLRETITDGRIRPTVTVFHPSAPDRPGPRIWNEQLTRYAGYRVGNTVVGDPRSLGFTDLVRQLGWSGRGGRFDLLPLVVQAPGHAPRVYDLPGEVVHEVPLSHPRFGWFAELGLRWFAVPAISNMCLEIGGICYRAAPFNGWYMGTEIGARNLGDNGRYDQLPVIAERMGLDTSSERTLWRDLALVEANVAVLHSFALAGVTITDHHTESRRFLEHLRREEEAGRSCPADWSWIVPPVSGSTTPVFHRYYDDVDLRPNYVYHPEAVALARGNHPRSSA
jgi:nitric-oxide synthase